MTTPILPGCALLLALLTAGPLGWSQDMLVNDLTIEVGGYKGPRKVVDAYDAGANSAFPTNSSTASVKASTSSFIHAGYNGGHLYHCGGLIWGGGMNLEGGSPDLTNPPAGHSGFSYANFGPYAYIGYGHAIGRRCFWEVAPYISAGFADADWYDQNTSGAIEKDTAYGGFFDIGARGSVQWVIARHYCVGVVGGYIHSDDALHVDYSDTKGKSRLTFHSNSGFLGVSFSYRFGGWHPARRVYYDE